MTGYQGRSIGTGKSSGHPAIPAPQDCPWSAPGTLLASSPQLLLFQVGSSWQGWEPTEVPPGLSSLPSETFQDSPHYLDRSEVCHYC